MYPTQIEEENKEEARNEWLVLDRGAAAHYYPTVFDKEIPNDGTSKDNWIIIVNRRAVHSSRQDNTEIVNSKFMNELKEALLLVGTLVRQQEH